MKFKGDIIITDPCYIMKDDNEEEITTPRPMLEDYVGASEIKLEETSVGKPESMDDLLNELSKMMANIKKVDELHASEGYRKYQEAVEQWEKANGDDWDKCDNGRYMEALGINTYLTRDTMYGDWSCTTYNSDTKEVLGKFCADAGLVSVFLLDEILAYNPDFDSHTKKPWTTTLIKDFDGEIEIKVVDIKYREEETGEEVKDQEVRVIGKGNINFFTSQTGF